MSSITESDRSSSSDELNVRNNRRIRLLTDSSSEESVSEISISNRHRRSRGKYNNISSDKKDILIKFYEEGKTITESAEIAGINKNTATSIINRYKKDGYVAVKKRGGRRHSKLNTEILNKIEEIIERNSSITLKGIREKILEIHNVDLSTTSIHNALKTLRITLKTATINIDRINCDTTIQRRIPYALNFAQNAPDIREKIIFIDESGFNYHLRRNKARSRVNTAAHVIVPTVRGRNVSLIAAMNIHGVLHKKIVANSSVNTDIFTHFLEELFNNLVESNITGAWLILDNAQIHKTQIVKDKIAEFGHTLVFLPPYSPMLNPIEKVFSKTKLCARNLLADPDINMDLVAIIKKSVESVTPSDCNNYYVDMTMSLSLAASGEPLQ
ncbi:uncharacterized protein LOC119601452 [Lucilia sericata]|uniref:uncharacterized protein LOC119601452 n=1 Tax=Lucilia sericata TaxID=13632 RepID=UPI0018A86EED|nr:uncharacterized protein LOC119601452 [Lucilia sericata]